MKSILLECSILAGSHTSCNLAQELQRVVTDFNLQHKITLAISDNAANIKRAIKEELQWRHLGCFAHLINLIIRDGLAVVKELLEKIKTMVIFFKRSGAGREKLMNFQSSMGCTQPRKLLLDVETRWNSTFYMLQRFCELEDAIKSSIALVDKDLPILTSVHELCKILKPFESVTTSLSGENYATASVVIVLVNGLNDIYDKLLLQNFTHTVHKVIQALKTGIENRLGNVENSNILTLCTFLDPRFKTIPFQNPHTAEKVKRNVTNVISNKRKSSQIVSNEGTSQSNSSESDELSPWNLFNKCLANAKPQGTSTSRAILEVQRYMYSDILDHSGDPLKWWYDHRAHLPHLSGIAQETLCSLATSVPCEILFSKAGLFLNERRTRLQGSTTPVFECKL